MGNINYETILRQYFGYDSFRGIQKEIVESIGAGHDTLGLMPTGGGKSVSFQVPALAAEGVCIVVTPLISLMKDQVDHLRDRGILAAYVTSSMSYSDIQRTFDNAILGGVKFLYVSPERLATPLFKMKLNYMKVCFIAVDEAHCISQWGYDFRPSYLQIAQIREQIPDVPILALTATATPDVVEDIQRQLKFREPRVFKMSFKRDNLVYVVRNSENKIEEMVHILDRVKGAAIIYVRNREKTKEIALALQKRGMTATFYHAGLDFAVKDQRQQDWQQDKTRVIVATNAFGMGIDKSDVRLVIHYEMPDSIESYFQEAGRAGRDGQRSYAVLLYSKDDKKHLINNVRKSFPAKDYLRVLYDHLAYYFQLAVDDGEGARYEFNMSHFCYTFRHFPDRVENGLAMLQRAGYLRYEPDADNQPRVKFLVDRESLYRLRDVSKWEDAVITALLRLYGSLFSDFTFVDISLIGSLAQMDDERVAVCLKELSHRGLLKFVPRRDVPRITYLRQRVDSSRLHFDKEIYELMFEKNMHRAEAMVNYVDSSECCRQRYLLKYFGEESEDCGKCDVCLSNKNAEIPKPAENSLRAMIIEKIKNGELTRITELQHLDCSRAELMSVINAMREDGTLLLDGIKLKLSIEG